MKVWINKRTREYSGGMIIVAANTAEEAQQILLQSNPSDTWMVDKDGYVCFEKEECVIIENDHYELMNWQELPHVHADFEVPTFIAEDGYSE